MGDGPVIVAMKVVPLVVDVHPLTGAVEADPKLFGVSPADRSALSFGLRLAAQLGTTVTAVSIGGPQVEPALREALSQGAAEALRVDVGELGHLESGDLLRAQPTSAAVAAALATIAGAASAVVCGDYSLDRASGSVPLRCAHLLDWPVIAGASSLRWDGDGLEAIRRLERGALERTRVTLPAVVSVEAGVAPEVRAPLQSLLASQTAEVSVRHVEVPPAHEARQVSTGPYRPRPPAADAPVGTRAHDRVVELTGALTERSAPERVVATPEAAAAAILAKLAAWGYR